MALVTLPNLGPDPFTVNASVLNGKVDPLATDYNGNIQNVNIASGAGIVYSKLTLTDGVVNADINSAAAIASSKLDLSAIAQNLVMSSKIVKLAKGADVASVAGAMTLGDDGNYFDITGTEAITSITAKTAGTVVTLQFDSTASLVDGSNLKLQGNFTGAAEAQITLVSDGTNWFEVSRNNGSALAAASQAEMETGTSTTVYVTPGRTQFHPGVCKAWCSFDGTGTPAMRASYNFDSTITDNGTGDYTLTVTTDFSSAAWAFAGSGKQSADDQNPIINMKHDYTATAGAINIEVAVASSGAETDFPIVNLVCFGDQ